jgi:hypothetical protein
MEIAAYTYTPPLTQLYDSIISPHSSSYRKTPLTSLFSHPHISSFSPLFLPKPTQSPTTPTLSDHSPTSISPFPLSYLLYIPLTPQITTPLFLTHTFHSFTSYLTLSHPIYPYSTLLFSSHTILSILTLSINFDSIIYSHTLHGGLYLQLN